MADEPKSLVALRDARERVIARLSDAFAEDALDVEEFERRITLAHRAEAPAELEKLVADLGAPAKSTALVPAPAPAPPARADDGQRRTVAAVMGGVSRRGPWTPPRNLRVIAVMGGVDLDFREASLPPGVTDVQIITVMGGADILVPPTLAVEAQGVAIMGGFDHADRAPQSPDPERPVLRIHGFACMGGVSIRTRLPGESSLEAWVRTRKERRALRAQRRGKLPPGEP